MLKRKKDPVFSISLWCNCLLAKKEEEETDINKNDNRLKRSISMRCPSCNIRHCINSEKTLITNQDNILSEFILDRENSDRIFLCSICKFKTTPKIMGFFKFYVIKKMRFKKFNSVMIYLRNKVFVELQAIYTFNSDYFIINGEINYKPLSWRS